MYLIIPAEAPAQLIDRHIHAGQDVVSDLLGGAWPMSILVPGHSMALHVRDDCITAGLDRNRLASVLFSAMARYPLPVFGPAVLTGVVEIVAFDLAPTAAHSLGTTWCLDPDAAEGLKGAADDAWAVLTGQTHLIEPAPDGPDRPTVADYVHAIQSMDATLETTPVSPDYPFVATRRDRLAEGLAKHGVHVQHETTPIREEG